MHERQDSLRLDRFRLDIFRLKNFGLNYVRLDNFHREGVRLNQARRHRCGRCCTLIHSHKASGPELGLGLGLGGRDAEVKIVATQIAQVKRQNRLRLHGRSTAKHRQGPWVECLGRGKVRTNTVLRFAHVVGQAGIFKFDRFWHGQHGYFWRGDIGNLIKNQVKHRWRNGIIQRAGEAQRNQLFVHPQRVRRPAKRLGAPSGICACGDVFNPSTKTGQRFG